MTPETNLPKNVTVVNQPGTIVTELTVRQHAFICDEEPLYGGHDAAPDPYDYIIAAVGSCTAISLRQFAERKGWEIGRIEIALSYDEVDGADIVHKEIGFSETLTTEQRAVLLRVAHCGTEKMLEKGMTFVNALRP